MSFARNFRIGKEGKYVLQVRGEFQNVFNHLQLPTPTVSGPGINPLTPVTPVNGVNLSGYGVIATNNGIGYTPRNGQAVIRFQF